MGRGSGCSRGDLSHPGKTWNGILRVRLIPASSAMEGLPLVPPGILAFPVFPPFPGKSPLLLFAPEGRTKLIPTLFQSREKAVLHWNIPRVHGHPKRGQNPGKSSLGEQGSDPHLKECSGIPCLESVRGILSMSSEMGSELGNVQVPTPVSHIFFILVLFQWELEIFPLENEGKASERIFGMGRFQSSSHGHNIFSKASLWIEEIPG